MITFVSPQDFFYLLVLFPMVVLFLRGFARRQEALRVFRQRQGGLLRDTLTRICLFAFALFFLAAALAHPVVKSAYTQEAQEAEYLFLVDTSTSMGARETLVLPSSLERAKKIIKDTLNGSPDSCAAIFLFAELAFPVSSLTCDRDILQGVVDKEIRVDRVPNPGTDIPNALLVAGDRIADPSSIYHPVTQIIVLTDGGDEELTAAQAAKINALVSPSIPLIFVGVGEMLGAPIPVFDEHGSFTGQYMQADGSTYYARLNERILRDMAAQLHGYYFSQDQEQALLNFLQKKSLEHSVETLPPVNLQLLSFAAFTIVLFVLLWRRDL